MRQKASHELFPRHLDLLPLAAVSIVLHAERDDAILVTEDAGIADRSADHVPRQVVGLAIAAGAKSGRCCDRPEWSDKGAAFG